MIINQSKNCKYDIISLGEVMIRFDPGDGRIRNSRSFKVWEGGGEYNVSRAFTKCFNKRSAIITSFTENEIGYLIKDLIMQGGVDTKLIHWKNFDGIGRISRNGIYFLEKGFGIRGALGCSDRGHTAHWHRPHRPFARPSAGSGLQTHLGHDGEVDETVDQAFDTW